MATKKKALTGRAVKVPHPPTCICVACESLPARHARRGRKGKLVEIVHRDGNPRNLEIDNVEPWSVGDDEDGYCAMGPKRRTQTEARRDFPQRGPAPTTDGAILLVNQPDARRNGVYVRAEIEKAIPVSMSAGLRETLGELLATGLFGPTIRVCLEEMVRKGVRAAILEGWAPLPNPGPFPTTQARRKR